MSPSSGRDRLTVLAAAASIAATALVPVAVADQDPRSSSTLDVDVERNEGFTYEMATRGDVQRQTTGQFDMDAFRLNLSYTSSNGTSELRRVNASLTLEGIYEFRDGNGNGRFDLGDEVVRFDPVQPGRWSSVDHVETPGQLEILRATTPLEGDGEVRFEVLVSPEPIRVSPERHLRPLDAKVHVTLQDLEPTGEDTRFSLAMRLEGSQLDRTDAHAVTVTGDGADLRYGWSDTATRNGVSTPLNSTLVEQDVTRDGQERTELLVLHTLEPANRIELHNSVELEETRSPIPEAFTGIVGNPPLYVGGLLAAILLVGGNAWLKLQEGEGGSGRAWRSSRE